MRMCADGLVRTLLLKLGQMTASLLRILVKIFVVGLCAFFKRKKSILIRNLLNFQKRRAGNIVKISK